MQATNLDQAIVDDKNYGSLDRQHVLFSTLRKEDPVHWTEPPGFRPFWTVSKQVLTPLGLRWSTHGPSKF